VKVKLNTLYSILVQPYIVWDICNLERLLVSVGTNRWQWCSGLFSPQYMITTKLPVCIV